MTEDIFRLDDLELDTWYVDWEGRILSSEEDLFLVLNREYSRRMFVFGQKGLFMHWVDKVFYNFLISLLLISCWESIRIRIKWDSPAVRRLPGFLWLKGRYYVRLCNHQ